MRKVMPLRLAFVVFALIAWAKVADMLHKHGYYVGWEAVGASTAFLLVGLSGLCIAYGLLKSLFDWVFPHR